ncbi:MAG TPA: PqiC family protein [Candidatus Kryptonia bacterium]|nr:PqiC family protein [Candidatus Kryptonia bacterium]
MAYRVAHLFSIVLVAAAVSGCGTSATARFYTLDSAATAAEAPAARYAVVVGPVFVPAAVDRPQFVLQVAPNRVEIDEFNRWAAPLDDGIARAVAGDLATLLGTPEVALAALPNFKPAYRVTIDVQRFESIPGEAIAVDAVWTVRKTADGSTRSGRTVARETVPDRSFEALAAAHSRALAQMSGDIAAAIRAAEASPVAADANSKSSQTQDAKPEGRKQSKTQSSKRRSE